MKILSCTLKSQNAWEILLKKIWRMSLKKRLNLMLLILGFFLNNFFPEMA